MYAADVFTNGNQEITKNQKRVQRVKATGGIQKGKENEPNLFMQTWVSVLYVYRVSVH